MVDPVGPDQSPLARRLCFFGLFAHMQMMLAPSFSPLLCASEGEDVNRCSAPSECIYSAGVKQLLQPCHCPSLSQARTARETNTYSILAKSPASVFKTLHLIKHVIFDKVMCMEISVAGTCF